MLTVWAWLAGLAAAGPWTTSELAAFVRGAEGQDAAVSATAYAAIGGVAGLSGAVVGAYTRDGGSRVVLFTVYPRDGGSWRSEPLELGAGDAPRVVGVLDLGREGTLPRRGLAPAPVAPVQPVLVVEQTSADGRGGRTVTATLVALADPAHPRVLLRAAVEESVAIAPPGSGALQTSLGWSADAIEVRRGEQERELVIVGRDRPTPDAGCPGPDREQRWRIVGGALVMAPVGWGSGICRPE